jgi:hypothetical protein
MTRTVRTALAATALSALLCGCSTVPSPGAQATQPRPDRGGIDGNAISLDNADPNLRDYLAAVKDKIKKHWSYPCVPNPTTQVCEYKTVKLVVEFGIVKDGALGYVEVKQTSGAGLERYDESAVTAIKRAAPFVTIPPEIMATRKQGSAGIPIVVRFNYVVENSLSPGIPGFPGSSVSPGPAQSEGRSREATRASVLKAGVITLLEGNVTAQRQALPVAVPLQRGDDVFLQDTIATGDGAQIEMRLGGKADVRIAEKSLVTIADVMGRSTLALRAGQLGLHVRGDYMLPGEEIHVRTFNALARVPSSVRMSVETLSSTQAGVAGVTHIDVLNGTISVATYANTPQSDDIYAGIAATPPIRLRANEGLTITGNVAGAIRGLRSLPDQPPKNS